MGEPGAPVIGMPVGATYPFVPVAVSMTFAFGFADPKSFW